MNYRVATAFLTAITALLTLFWLGATLSLSRDHGQFANSPPELRQWFQGLQSGRGPCCSDADGSALSDVDWESNGTHYRVRIDGQWIDVPEDAVLPGPNMAGKTMVWPMWMGGSIVIRCFIPGSMT